MCEHLIGFREFWERVNRCLCFTRAFQSKDGPTTNYCNILQPAKRARCSVNEGSGTTSNNGSNGGHEIQPKRASITPTLMAAGTLGAATPPLLKRIAPHAPQPIDVCITKEHFGP